MQHATILHMFTPASNLSPFDVNMAIDAGWQHCLPYTSLETDQIPDFTQDTIFSRGPKGVAMTGIFIGGRDIFVALDMLESAKQSMVPPFEVSVFADPSGAFTTAAGMIACTERQLAAHANGSLVGKSVLVFGGTGPVGATCGMLAVQSGADVGLVSHGSKARAEGVAAKCAERYGVQMQGYVVGNDEQVKELLSTADVVFGAAKAGVQLLNDSHLAAATRLKVACDVNAVPPEGIAGVSVTDDGKPIAATPAGAVGIGALAVGNIKYRTQSALLQQMVKTKSPVYLAFEQALAEARTQV